MQFDQKAYTFVYIFLRIFVCIRLATLKSSSFPYFSVARQTTLLLIEIIFNENIRTSVIVLKAFLNQKSV